MWAEIDLGAVRHNATVLRAMVAPAALCCVVKADAYGHGSVALARAALDGGATWLAVALAEEGRVLRAAGIAAPILVLSEPPAADIEAAVVHGLVPTLYTSVGVHAAADAARRAGLRTDVHVKVDTGMHRVGADPDDVLDIVRLVTQCPELRFAALWTHLAVSESRHADDVEFTELQLARFAAVRGALEAAGMTAPAVHAANSAAAIAYPSARLDMVRCGIASYGVLPAPDMEATVAAHSGGEALLPVLSFKARVSMVRELAAGERPSYGRLRALPERSVVATVPVGYADGVPRRFFTEGGTVLIGGRRRPLAGMVTMDQIVVDCGPGADVAVGDEVVLIGSQGDDALSAQYWADVLGTIGYEVLCGIGKRVPRLMVDNAGDQGEGT